MSKNTVTQEQIAKLISEAKIDVTTVQEKCTVVTVTLKSGFILSESSACVDKANYNEEIGARCCMERIERKLWELEGYVLSKKLYKTTGESLFDRVYSEAVELKVKLEKLQDFMGSTKFEALSYVDKYLLMDQEFAMHDYLDILTARISAMTKKAGF